MSWINIGFIFVRLEQNNSSSKRLKWQKAKLSVLPNLCTRSYNKKKSSYKHMSSINLSLNYSCFVLYQLFNYLHRNGTKFVPLVWIQASRRSIINLLARSKVQVLFECAETLLNMQLESLNVIYRCIVNQRFYMPP